MLACISWLNQWVNTDNVKKLAEQLTLAGLEVARLEPAGKLSDRSNVVIGRIIACAEHPEDQRLKICEVDAGEDQALSIVCGAPNARNGLLTACARAGAKLPQAHVESIVVRGIQSEGMLCSAAELGLEDAEEGIIEFDQQAPVGCSVVEYLQLSEPVAEFELTPNRGDCLGMIGIAREVAVLNGLAAEHREVEPVIADIEDALSIDLEAASGCPRYVGRILQCVNNHLKTPDWMIERLRRSGMRSINPVVDVTNYVMHELGQPMHAFDRERIQGGIRVRMASANESLRLLDGKQINLAPDYLVIADHERAIALAGIMGGADTAITRDSEVIFLESAYFSPEAIHGKARKLGMQTDASHRFERGVDPEMQIKAMEMATNLIIEIAGGSAGPLIHSVSEEDLPQRKPVLLEEADLARLLGDSINPNLSESILRNLGFALEKVSTGWRATPPSWRFDIQSAHDLVEEVGRCVGFDVITPRVRTYLPENNDARETDISAYDVKQRMMTLGYHEAVTYSFVDPAIQDCLMPESSAAIMLKNPIAENMSAMRKSLWPGLLEAVSNNLKRQEKLVRLFEVGAVFLARAEENGEQEKLMMAAVACGHVQPRQWGVAETKIDFFDLKGDLMDVFALTQHAVDVEFRKIGHSVFQPGQGAELFIDNRSIGLLGKLHPAAAKQFDIEEDLYMFEVELQSFLHAKLPRFADVSRFPAVHRDLALVVDESTEVKLLEDEIKSSAGNLLKNIALFDVFRGAHLGNGTKSMAFGLTFQSNLGNLTAQEIDNLIEKIVHSLETKMGASLRG